MSEVLEELLKRSSQMIITDQDQIDMIMKRLLSMKFSYLHKDKVNYENLRNNLSEGFNISIKNLDNMTLSDILVLTGYAPGYSFYNSPIKKNKNINSAGISRFIGSILKNLSQMNDVRIKEFMHIGIEAYSHYIGKRIAEEWNNKRISNISRIHIQVNADEFIKNALLFLDTGDEEIATLQTIGSLINKAINGSLEPWLTAYEPLKQYASFMMENYDILNRLFMDGIRMPLIANADRCRFSEIISQNSEFSIQELTQKIDFSKCYEP